MATSVPSCGMIQSAGRSRADPSGGPRRQSSSQTNHASFTGASFLLCGFVWPSVCSDEALTDFIAEGDSGRPAWNGRLHFRHKQNFPERWVVPRNDSGAGFGVFEELGIYLYLLHARPLRTVVIHSSRDIFADPCICVDSEIFTYRLCAAFRE